MVAPALAASAIFPDAALPHATGVVVPEAPPRKQGLKVEYVAALAEARGVRTAAQRTTTEIPMGLMSCLSLRVECRSQVPP